VPRQIGSNVVPPQQLQRQAARCETGSRSTRRKPLRLHLSSTKVHPFGPWPRTFARRGAIFSGVFGRPGVPRLSHTGRESDGFLSPNRSVVRSRDGRGVPPSAGRVV